MKPPTYLKFEIEKKKKISKGVTTIYQMMNKDFMMIKTINETKYLQQYTTLQTFIDLC